MYWEALFYLLLLPFIALRMTARPPGMPTWIVPAGLFVAAILIRFGLPAGREAGTYLGQFAAGMLVWEAVQRPSVRTALTGTPVAAAAAAIALGGILLLPAPGLATIILYVPLFACAAAGNSFGGIFSRRSSVALGEASYGIYLLHLLVIAPILLSLRGTEWVPGRTILLLLPLLMPLIVGVAGLAFLLVERPMISVGHRLARRAGERRRNTTAGLIGPPVHGSAV